MRIAPARFLCALLLLTPLARGATFDTPPDPGFENSVRDADVIVEVEILAGGPFRAAALTRKVLKGDVPKVFELAGYNSYNWDTVHNGFATGSRSILFLSTTGQKDVFAPLTPAAPRLSVQPDGVMLSLGDPPFRIPVNKKALEEGIALLVEAHAAGKTPERAEAFLRGLWDEGEIESRYLVVALTGALRDARATQLLIDASKDKLLKMRFTAIEALGKVASPQAIGALRTLLKDEKPSVAREAARVLINTGDGAALADLLEWARRYVVKAPALKPATNANKAIDGERAKTEQVVLDVIAFATAAGPLLDRAALCRPLLDMARSANETLARAALQALSELAQASEIPALLELAEDRTCEWNMLALTVLQRLTLKYFKSAAEFRDWWTRNGADFSEEIKRSLVGAYAQGLAASQDLDERRALQDLLRAAPGELALVSAAPLLLHASSSTLFGADDLDSWRTPLALPFLVERLGQDTNSERRSALHGLVHLATRHPRLRTVIWPLIRAALADPDSSSRRIAQVAAGTLQRIDAIPALLDAVQYSTGFECSDAGRAIYNLATRTFGFSISEPVADQDAARKRVRGWWQNAQRSFRASGHMPPGLPVFGGELEAAERGTRLEALALDKDSHSSGAAFAQLYAERSSADAFWQKLLGQTRPRDRAHGLLGLLAGDEALAWYLAQRLNEDDSKADVPLCRAISVLALATLKGPTGPEKVVQWLKERGDKIEPASRRLGIIALGLADREPKSLAFLDEMLEAGLPARERDFDIRRVDSTTDQYAALKPVLVALCARSDSNSLLVKALERGGDSRVRETAARALSLRRHHPALAGILKALEKADRYEWYDLCRMADPLLQPEDGPAVRTLLDSTSSSARGAAAYLLNQRPEIGTDEDTRAQLQIGLADPSSVVRYYSAQALGKRRATEAVRKLTALLLDDDEEVRAGAAEALGTIGDKGACAIVALAADKEYRLDARWLRALAISGTQSALDMLFKLCGSTAYSDQRMGLDALGASELPAATTRLLKVFHNDETAMQTVAGDALAQRGDAALEALRQDLKDKDKAVRVRALYLLSRVNTAASRAAARAVLGDEDESVRALAEFVLRLHDQSPPRR